MENKNIRLLVTVLKDLELPMQESSARRRFMRLLTPLYDDVELELHELKKKYADKNPDGQIKTVGNQLQFTLENRRKFNEDQENLMSINAPVDAKGHEQDVQTVITILSRFVQEFEAAHKDQKFNSDDFDMLERIKEAKDQVAMLVNVA